MQNKIKETTKRLGIAVVALTMLGLAAVFSLCEPTSVSAKVVTSGDVRLISERMVVLPDAPAPGKNGTYGKYGKNGHSDIR